MSRMQSFWRVALAGIAAWGVAVVSHAQQAQPADDLNELNNAINPCRVDRNLPRKTLQECTAIALQQQPALQAIRASLQQAEIGLESLRKVGRVGTLLVPDLKVRREQAERGVAVLYAELGQAEVDARYRVARLYFSAVCAEILYCLAKEGAEVLEDNAKNIEATLNDVPPRDFPFTTYSVNRLKTLAATLAAKREEARLGYYLALAALREACGVGPDCLFAPADTNLPYVRVTLTREEIVTQALARRGELFMAMLGAEVVHLEAQAQDSVRFRPSFRTFASGSDIHSRALPVEQRGKDYAPGAIGLEMPVLLAGSRATRVGRALALGERADAVVAKTRNLITLDAEAAFYLWQEANSKLDELLKVRDQVRAIRKIDDFKGDIEAIISIGLAAQAEATLTQALLDHTLALINIERATAGGIATGFATPVPALPTNGLPKRPNVANGDKGGQGVGGAGGAGVAQRPALGPSVGPGPSQPTLPTTNAADLDARLLEPPQMFLPPLTPPSPSTSR
jgi:outer membrane protein TolC